MSTYKLLGSEAKKMSFFGFSRSTSFMRKYIVYLLLALFIITPLTNVFAQGTNYRYTGQENDPNSNLYYYGQRYYQPEVGRFIQPDPVSKYLTDPQKLNQATGQDLQEFLENPQKLNEYSYTINNPVKYTDPTGEFPILIPVAIAVFSGVFFNGIKTAHAPGNSTPIIERGERNIDDFLPGISQLPPLARFGGALALSTVLSGGNPSGALTSIFHGTSEGAVKGILKNGWEIREGGGAFFSNLKSTGNWFAKEQVLDGLVGKIMEFKISTGLLSSLESKGLLEITNLSNGEKYYNFSKVAVDQIIKLSQNASSEVKLFIHNITQ